jgi:hypothetical protein
MSDADLLPSRHSVSHLALMSGPFSYSDAVAAGLTRARIRTLLASGAWVVLRRGIFCDANVGPTRIRRGSARLRPSRSWLLAPS